MSEPHVNHATPYVFASTEAFACFLAGVTNTVPTKGNGSSDWKKYGEPRDRPRVYVARAVLSWTMYWLMLEAQKLVAAMLPPNVFDVEAVMAGRQCDFENMWEVESGMCGRDTASSGPWQPGSDWHAGERILAEIMLSDAARAAQGAAVGVLLAEFGNPSRKVAAHVDTETPFSLQEFVEKVVSAMSATISSSDVERIRARVRDAEARSLNRCGQLAHVTPRPLASATPSSRPKRKASDK